MDSNPRRTNICFDCQRACGYCSWTETNPETGKTRFEPVPGWTAEKVLLNVAIYADGVKATETYHITECPLFVRDEKRKSLPFGMDQDSFNLLKERWRSLGELG